MTIDLALLCKDGKGLSLMDQHFTITENNTVEPTTGQIWRTDKWVISENNIKDLIGKSLALLPSRDGKSYLGGEIVGYYPIETDNIVMIPKASVRYGLLFREQSEMKGLTVPNWKSRNPVYLNPTTKGE